MKKSTKSLALLLALLMAFGISASAAGFPPPDDVSGLPALTLGVTANGVIAKDETLWYTFTPTQGGYYNFTVTGGYDRCSGGTYDYFIIGATGHIDDGNFVNWDVPYYEQGKTYYARVYAIATSNASIASDNYTVTPKLYQFAQPLKYQKIPSGSFKAALEGSAYSIADIEHYSIRGNLAPSGGHSSDHSDDGNQSFYKPSNDGSPGYIDFYFSDGIYTTVEIGSRSLLEIFEVDGIEGVIEQILGFLAIVPALPLLGVVLSFFFAPFSGFMTLFTLLPVSIIAIPLGFLFLPFSLLALLFR